MKLNVRQRRRAATRQFHALKLIEARLLGILVDMYQDRTRRNIHLLQVAINAKREKL